MLRGDRRFVVSHVGSMVRPPAMIPYLQKARAGEPYDKGAFEACLTDSVIEAVRLQADAGIDAVSDGEYGKSGTWAFYVHRRLKGIEWHPFTKAEAKDPMIAVISGRDREAFPEFYAEYDARVLAVSRSAGRPVVTAPLVYTGHAELHRDIANLKAGLAHSRTPATSITATRKVSCSRWPRRCAPSTARSLMPGSTFRSTTHSSPSCTRKWCRQ
jgi:5-methyltetrahydropteroyltriglutamate--homocysteine methyltransferase